MASKRGRRTTDAVEILRRRFVEGNPESEALLEEVRADAEVARTIYRLRSGAGLTQQALAERVGTTASVISRLEDADYTGHSLAMLRRIAAALGRRVEIRFPTVKTIKDPAATGKISVRSGNRRSRSKSGTSSP
ncbi:MAG: XRE family transcriptional regulator [Isosphaeraceae bacterium]